MVGNEKLTFLSQNWF